MAISEAQKAASEKYRLKNWETIREKVRVRNYNKYHNDPEYRARKIEREKKYYQQKKLKKQQELERQQTTLTLEE